MYSFRYNIEVGLRAIIIQAIQSSNETKSYYYTHKSRCLKIISYEVCWQEIKLVFLAYMISCICFNVYCVYKTMITSCRLWWKLYSNYLHILFVDDFKTNEFKFIQIKQLMFFLIYLLSSRVSQVKVHIIY